MNKKPSITNQLTFDKLLKSAKPTIEERMFSHLDRADRITIGDYDNNGCTSKCCNWKVSAYAWLSLEPSSGSEYPWKGRYVYIHKVVGRSGFHGMVYEVHLNGNGINNPLYVYGKDLEKENPNKTVTATIKKIKEAVPVYSLVGKKVQYIKKSSIWANVKNGCFVKVLRLDYIKDGVCWYVVQQGTQIYQTVPETDLTLV